MKPNSDDTIRLSPTDLTIFSARRHSSYMDSLKAEGPPLAKPEQSPHAETLAELGRRHDQA